MSTSPGFDLVIGLDRSDRKVDLCVLFPATGESAAITVSTAPEALLAYFSALREAHPRERIGLCLEQPAANLLGFFDAHTPWLEVYPVNPVALKRFREAFVSSRANDDAKDARYLARLLATHADEFTRWAPEDAATRALQQLVANRRAVVDERTLLTNRLQAILKAYFPQALELCGDELWRPLALAFLARWPSLQSLQNTKPATLRAFYHRHGSRSQKCIQKRLQGLENAVPLIEEPALIEVWQLRVQLIIQELRALGRVLAIYDQKIAHAFAAHPDAPIFASLPGAGPVLAPRLQAAVGSRRERFDSPAALQSYTGIAPVTKQSGGKRHVHRRYICPTFLRQSFHEYARESIRHSQWAAAYYAAHRAKGSAHHATVRALAYKWQRIIWRCWQDRKPYSETAYLHALQRSGSTYATKPDPSIKLTHITT
jgi:transposase